jgi:hypothetical protein
MGIQGSLPPSLVEYRVLLKFVPRYTCSGKFFIIGIGMQEKKNKTKYWGKNRSYEHKFYCHCHGKVVYIQYIVIGEQTKYWVQAY